MSTTSTQQKWIFYIFLIYLSAQIITGEAPATLKFTSILFRHGDRSAIRAFPGDLHNESAWPQGYGQLSQEGMKQEFALGQFMRARYNGFLDAAYRRWQVYVEATTYDRTIMSAQSVLAGLYPPINDHWNKEKQWQPVPVHIIDDNNEKMLRYNATRCPALDRIAEEKRNGSTAQQLRSKYKGLLERLSNATGGQISDVWDLYNLYDGLLCEDLHGLAWPKWVNRSMVEMMQLEIFPVLQQEGVMCDPVAKRLTGGVLLDRILTDMRLKARNLMEQDLRAVLYSAHDTTVLALMCALGVYNYRLVPYATSLYMELHYSSPAGQEPDRSTPAGQMDTKFTGWFVQVWLRNKTDVAPYPITIPGCSFNCSLSNLVNLTRSSVPSNWYAECGFFTLPHITQFWHILLITLGSGIGFLFLLLLVTSCCHGKCARRRLRPRPSTYGKLRASEVMTRPEEMPMMGTTGGDSDIEG